ncbi:Uncharacterised protein [Mycobacteroides abscessus subsp. abscessus]|nr:Uncharacterised protein [Mycobacteroides abscessus subsp. abscessus]
MCAFLPPAAVYASTNFLFDPMAMPSRKPPVKFSKPLRVASRSVESPVPQ